MANKRLRLKLFHKAKKRCHYCKFEMNMKLPTKYNEASCTIDHVVPKSQGGWYDKAVAACNRCNNLKGNMSYENFVAWLALNPLPEPRVIRIRSGPIPVAVLNAAPSRKRTLPRPIEDPPKGATYALGEVLGVALKRAGDKSG